MGFLTTKLTYTSCLSLREVQSTSYRLEPILDSILFSSYWSSRSAVSVPAAAPTVGITARQSLGTYPLHKEIHITYCMYPLFIGWSFCPPFLFINWDVAIQTTASAYELLRGSRAAKPLPFVLSVWFGLCLIARWYQVAYVYVFECV